MTLMVDKQIADQLASDEPLASNISADDYKTASSNIQAASLDLTIGDIFIPGTEGDKLGGVESPKKQICLKQGHTAVIRTKEELALGPNFAGIAFPPSGVSLSGLLTTNPGHIDPGYRGPLHLTVINMGRDPFSLKRGDRIMRVLLLPLETAPEAPLDRRRPAPLPSPITTELLHGLSVDFVDVERRAKKIANRAVYTAGVVATLIPVSLAFLTLFGQSWVAKPATESDLRELSDRVFVLETEMSQQGLDERIGMLEQAVEQLRAAMPRR